jgi:pyruvate dehydrogenase E1 component alpha subunit
MKTKNANDGLMVDLLSTMVLIRAFEDKISQLAQEQGRLPGMQILATGQEAVAAGVVAALGPEDVLVSNHRSHGHLLARGADPGRLMAEIMGKATGVNKGKSGTLHLAVPEVNALMTSTVVGAGPPLAVGAAFAQAYRGEPNLTAVFFGDGAAAEGSVHEAMNLAALWRLPVLFICENNCWAGAQALAEHCSIGDLAARAQGYGMPGQVVDGNDAVAVHEVTSEMAKDCRAGKGPALLEAKTYRLRGHGEYDRQLYVDKQELANWLDLCPVKRLRATVLSLGLLSADDVESLERRMALRVEEAVRFADQSPYPQPAEALEDVWASSQGGV